MFHHRLWSDELHVDRCEWYSDLVGFLGMEASLDAVINEGDEACCDNDTGIVSFASSNMLRVTALTQRHQ